MPHQRHSLPPVPGSDLDTLVQHVSDPEYRTQSCPHMQSRTVLTKVRYGANEHSCWLRCPTCQVTCYSQTHADLACARCIMRECQAGGRARLFHLGKCVWAHWGRFITRLLCRMTHWQISERVKLIMQEYFQELKLTLAHTMVRRLHKILSKSTRARRIQGYQQEDPQDSEGSYHRPTRRRIDAIKVSAVKGPETDDHHCMLDSGANVLVIPWKEDTKGDPTMCALVGNNQTEGLIVARLTTQNRTHLTVAVRSPSTLWSCLCVVYLERWTSAQ